MTAMKSVENSWKRGIDKGKKTLTDVMNSIYQSRIMRKKEKKTAEENPDKTLSQLIDKLNGENKVLNVLKYKLKDKGLTDQITKSDKHN